MTKWEQARIQVTIAVDGKQTEALTFAGDPGYAFDRAIGALVDASTDYAPNRDGGTGRSLRAVPDPDETA